MLIAVGVLFAVPFYVVAVLSLKSNQEIQSDPLSLPTSPHWENYREMWAGTSAMNVTIGRSLLNNLIVTVGSVALLIVLGSACGYVLARRGSRLSTGVYFLFVAGIVIPFWLGLVPIYVTLRDLHLTGTYLGMIVLNVGLMLPLTVFLYTGFIRMLPKEYEEAAQVDGAGLFRTLFRVVLPLLAPITGTVAVLTGLFCWNDFFLPLIFLERQREPDAAGRDLPVRRQRDLPVEPDLPDRRRRARADHGLLPLRPEDARAGLHRRGAGLMAAVTFSGVGKVYPDGTRAVNDLDLDVARRRVHRPRRPVRLRQDDGAAHGRRARGDHRGRALASASDVVNDVEPRKRDVAMVFQNYALYPHMTRVREHRLRACEPQRARRRRSRASRARRRSCSG